MVLVLSIILALLVSVNPFFAQLGESPRRYFRGWAVRFVVALIVTSLWIYFALPAFVGPFWGVAPFAIVMFAPNLIVSVLSATDFRGSGSSWRSAGELGPALIIWIGFGLLTGALAILSTGWFNANARTKMIGQVEVREFSKDFAPVDTDHIIMVSSEQAEYLANLELGKAGASLGSKFHVGEMAIQRVGERLVWVGSLEFNAWRHWLGDQYPPGYVVVDAENRDKPAELVTRLDGKDLALRYMPGSFFGDNLARHLWLAGYRDVHLVDTMLELDDSGKPFWVVTTTRPTELYTCEKVTGLVIVDPATGSIEHFPSDELDSIPDWVDRVQPEELTATYIDWWGKFFKGSWNAYVTGDGVKQATDFGGDKLKLIWGDDGRAYWFTGITSASSKDHSLVGYMLVDTRTGAAREYIASGGDENAVHNAVDSAVSNFSGWHATRPVLYNIHGRAAWAVPVVSASHLFQRLAVVDAETMQVALGATKAEAVKEFDKLITRRGNELSPSEVSSLEQIEAKVLRAERWTEDGNTTLFIELEGHPEKRFSVGLSAGNDVPLVRDGDLLRVSYLATGEGVVPVRRLVRVGSRVRSAPIAEEKKR